GGDHCDRQVSRERRDMANEIEALAVGQAHVGETQAVARPAEALLRLGNRAGRVDAQAHLEERELEQLADVGLVVDDEHALPGLARGPGAGAALGLFRARLAHAAGAARHRMRKCAPRMSSTYSSAARLAAHSSRAR